VILVDTNVLVAAARTADTHHVAAARLLLRETDDQFLVGRRYWPRPAICCITSVAPHPRWRSCAASPPASSS